MITRASKVQLLEEVVLCSLDASSLLHRLPSTGHHTDIDQRQHRIQEDHVELGFSKTRQTQVAPSEHVHHSELGKGMTPSRS